MLTRCHGDAAGGCRLLWEFLAELLLSSSCAGDVIRWEDESLFKFRVVDPRQLAERWGQEKGKAGMTYEKLSRALRYYYKTNILAKVRGQRLTYRQDHLPCYTFLVIVLMRFSHV